MERERENARTEHAEEETVINIVAISNDAERIGATMD